MNNSKVKENDLFHAVAGSFFCKVTLRMVTMWWAFIICVWSPFKMLWISCSFSCVPSGDIPSRYKAVFFLSMDWLQWDLTVQKLNVWFVLVFQECYWDKIPHFVFENKWTAQLRDDGGCVPWSVLVELPFSFPGTGISWDVDKETNWQGFVRWKSVCRLIFKGLHVFHCLIFPLHCSQFFPAPWTKPNTFFP